MSQKNKISEINAQSKNGLTPLHNAAVYGHDEIVRLLIEHNADVNAKTKTGNTPLHRAAVSPLIESLPVRFVIKTISQNETTFIKDKFNKLSFCNLQNLLFEIILIKLPTFLQLLLQREMF
jgi:ankyrin repeat protein